jgi:propanediol utilization protein
MFALSKTNYDRVLHIDNDELLGKKLKNEIRDLIKKARKEGFVAISTVRVNYDVKCKHTLFGPGYPDRQVRIYKI